MILTLNIKTKHQKSFLIYLFVLHLIFNKLHIVKKLINKNNYIIKFVLLKSPHINKIAQYHFGFNIYRKNIIIFLIDLTKFVLLIKLLICKLFHDIHIIVSYKLFRKIKVNIVKYYFTTFNLEITKFIVILQKISQMLQTLNFICLKVLIKS